MKKIKYTPLKEATVYVTDVDITIDGVSEGSIISAIGTTSKHPDHITQKYDIEHVVSILKRFHKSGDVYVKLDQRANELVMYGESGLVGIVATANEVKE